MKITVEMDINTDGTEEMVGLTLRADHTDGPPSPALAEVMAVVHEVAAGRRA